MHEADAHPVGDERGLAFGYFFKESECRVLGVYPVRKMTEDRVVRQDAQRIGVADRGKEFESADANVTGRDAREDRAGKRLSTENRFAGGGHCETARRRDAERVHGLADEIFAQHGAECGTAIAAARIGRGAGTFQLDIEPFARGRELLTQQDRAAVAEPGQVSVLVSGVCLRDGLGTGRNLIAGEDDCRVRIGESRGVESDGLRQRAVEEDEARFGDRRGIHARAKNLRETGVGIVKVPACVRSGGFGRCGHETERAGAVICWLNPATRCGRALRR